MLYEAAQSPALMVELSTLLMTLLLVVAQQLQLYVLLSGGIFLGFC